MQRLETLHPALSPSQPNRIYQPAIASHPQTPRASPIPQPLPPQNASVSLSVAGAFLVFSSQFLERPLALDSHAVAHAPLGEAQQSQLSAPSPRHDMRVQLGATPQHSPFSRVPPANLASSHALSASVNLAASPQLGLLPLSRPLSLESHSLFPVQYSQSASRVANTVVAPALSLPGTTPALHSVAPFVATQPVALQPFSCLQYGAASMQSTSQAGAPGVESAHPASQVGAPDVQCAQLVPQVEAPLAMGAQVEGVHTTVCTQPAFAEGTLFVTRVSSALQVGAPLVMGGQAALPVGAQLSELAVD